MKIFLASPQDVADERGIAEEVINEFNLTSGQHMNIRLELVRWETHTNPGLGKDGQDVINNQLSEDYDIFLGIMWKKFGSPTKRYDSGTQEEFNRAYEKSRHNKDEPYVMFYFCNRAPLSLDDIDIDQLSLVKTFKKSVSEMGLYYFPYDSVRDFEKLLKIQLPRVVFEIQNKQKSKETIELNKLKNEEVVSKSNVDLNNLEDERGVLDYLYEGERCFGLGNDNLIKIVSNVDIVKNRIVKQGENLSYLEASKLPIDTSAKIAMLNSIASDLLDFSNNINPELDSLEINFNKAIEQYSYALEYYYEMIILDKESIVSAFKHFDIFIDNISNAQVGIRTFKNAVDGFPKLSSSVIKARREASTSLERLLNILSSMAVLINEYQANLKRIIDDVNNEG